MFKKVRLIFIILIILFAAIQFVPVERTNPPVGNKIQLPKKIESILQNSCYDCHSNQTKWPWYSYLAPISWRIADHVKDGRKDLNFSTWNDYDLKKKKKKVDEIGEKVEEGKMPLKDYLLIHRNAKLSDAQKLLLKQWVKEELKKLEEGN